MPTALVPLIGTNTITGTVGGNVDDHFTFTVPQGRSLESFILADYQSTDAKGWIGVQPAEAWTAGEDANINPDMLRNNQHFGAINVGQNLLGIAKATPLPAGTYTVKVQQFGANSSYRFSLVLAPLQPLVKIRTARIGDLGNAPDANGLGRVDYPYSIGRYEVTVNQYVAFLNSVAASGGDDGFEMGGLYVMGGMDFEEFGKGWRIVRSTNTTSGPAFLVEGDGSLPISHVSWFSAAKFCNWLHNGATDGADLFNGSYDAVPDGNKLGDQGGLALRSATATWVIPSESEWYKAAYYKGKGTAAGYWRFPTQSDITPTASAIPTGLSNRVASMNKLLPVGSMTNSRSFYGAFDQLGNVAERLDNTNNLSVFEGGDAGVLGGWFGSTDLSYSGSREKYEPGSRDITSGLRLARLGPKTSDPVEIDESSPIITSASSANGSVGALFNYKITAANSPTSFGAAFLPAGLAVNATNGAIAGKPQQAGRFSASITARNAFGSDEAPLTITIAKGSQTITFPQPVNQVYGPNKTFLVVATAGSGLPVSFSSANSNIVTFSGSTATIKAAGTVAVTAKQSGDLNYNAASNVVRTITIAKAPQTITFPQPVNQVYGPNKTFPLVATAGSGLPVSLSSANSNIVTFSGTTATIKAAGTVAVTAKQSGNLNYNAASNVVRTITIAKAPQTITFTLPGTNAFKTNGLIPLNGKSSSGLPVAYTSAKPGILQIVGTNAVMKGRGTNTITASQTGNANYKAATNVTRTIIIR